MNCICETRNLFYYEEDLEERTTQFDKIQLYSILVKIY